MFQAFSQANFVHIALGSINCPIYIFGIHFPTFFFFSLKVRIY